MFRVIISSIFGLSLIFILVIDSHAQSIYAGGKGDGFSFNNFAQADNALLNIYSGGNNDGFSFAAFAQPDNVLFNIYSGGNNDGFAFNSFAQADNLLFAIYNGGVQDGFALNSFAQSDNILYAIYSGGIEDGFALKSFAQADNVLYAIYSGGKEDGFAFKSYAQADNVLYNIYNGGISDGFAFNRLGSIGSEVPLPIVLVSFIGKYQVNTIALKWKTASELNNDYFNLERSLSGMDFNLLYSVTGAGTTSQPSEYLYIDEKPFPGINYYRLKQVDFDGNFTYSEIISVRADYQSNQSILLFPNPSDPASDTQIMLSGVTSGTIVEVNISSITGQPVSSFEAVVDDFNQINIKQSVSSTLSAGIYLVSVKASTGIYVTKWVVR